MKRTLGGDRLGSGNKMNVELKEYERSTHNLGYIWKSTMAAGTLVPFMSKVVLPGDTFDIDLNTLIFTKPTVGPLFGSYKVQLDLFQVPMRLYIKWLHNNKLKVGLDMKQVALPFQSYRAFKMNNPADPDNAQINPSCILSYLGLRGIGKLWEDAEFSSYVVRKQALPLLSYWDIYKNYYANKQEEIGAVIHSERQPLVETIDEVRINATTLPERPATPILHVMADGDIIYLDWTGSAPLPEQIIIATSAGNLNINELCYDTDVIGTTTYCYVDFARWGAISIYSWGYIQPSELPVLPPKVVTFELDNIDEMREYLLSANPPVDIDGVGKTPYNYLSQTTLGQFTNLTNTQEGLGIKTYQSDLFNNWLNTEWIDGVNGISAVTAIDTSSGEFTIDTLNLATKIYYMLNRIAVSGGTYDDWIETVYTHFGPRRIEIPMYEGGLIKELIFEEVVSNAANGTQPLGTLAGRGKLGNKHKGGKVVIKVDEPGYIIGIVSLTPRLDYSQGNSWDYNLKTIDDLHKPQLDGIGFQDLIQEQMAWWTTNVEGSEPTTTLHQQSAGKQPAWINYMTSVNEVRGNFAIGTTVGEMFMTLNRRYEYQQDGSSTQSASIKDLTTYIDPAKFNHIFAQTSLDAQNFWVQIAVDITARRKMSGRIMPNL